MLSPRNSEENHVKIGANRANFATPIAVIPENSADDELNWVCANTACGETISLGESSGVEAGFDWGSFVTAITLNNGDSSTNEIMSDYLLVDPKDFDGPTSDYNMFTYGERNEDGDQLKVESTVVQLYPSSVQDSTLDDQEGSLQFPVEQCSTISGDYEKLESNAASNCASKKETSAIEMVDFEVLSALNAAGIQSEQICKIDLLEGIIEHVQNNKKPLLSAVESVASLMREVDIQEKAAEQAKEEAVMGGLDILTRVENLKQIMQCEKESNDMRAGEVYGEKAILAAEVRELQSCLCSLSDERNESLAILDEICQTLEKRLKTAEKERKEAEQEKIRKEESARNALAELEFMMEKLAEEA